jgi:Ca-activated chloride channel family protein
MIFENQELLWWLLVLPPILFILGLWGWKTKREAAVLFPSVLRRLNIRQIEKYVLAGVLMALLIIVLASPKVGYYATAKIEKTGEVALLVDVSRSMLAQKDLDSPNMLERTKPILYDIVSSMQEWRQVKIALFGLTNIARSLVPFVGIEDYDYLKATIKNTLEINSTPGGDTGFGKPLLELAAKFSEGDQPKIIVIVSDGEPFYWNLSRVTDEERELIEKGVAACVEKGIKVVTVGVGEAEGARVPLYTDGEFTGYAKSDGKYTDYVFYLVEDVLKELSFRTGGEYFAEQDTVDLTEYIAKYLETIEVEVDEDVKVYNSISHWFILASLPIWVVFVRRHILV